MQEAHYRVLIVDDEPDITAVLKRGLEHAGYNITTFNDPELALTYFKERYYDLCLFDIKMPKMNGFELYRALEKKDPKIKACFMTAYEVYRDEFARAFPNRQIHCFIKKPVSIRDLTAIVREQLGYSGNQAR